MDILELGEELLASIPTGSSPNLVSNTSCDECNDSGFCTLGFAMIDHDNRVFFYDLDNSNIKSFPLSPTDYSRLEIISGLQQRPDDGVIQPDGTITLLVDNEANPATRESQCRYSLYEMDTSSRWTRFDLPELDNQGRNSSSIIYRSARIYNSGSDLYLEVQAEAFDLQRIKGSYEVRKLHRDQFYQVSGYGVTDIEEEVPIHFRFEDGRLDHPLLPHSKRHVIGTTDSGISYSKRMGAGMRGMLIKWSEDGKVLGAGTIPSRTSSKRLIGKGFYQVSPALGPVRLVVTEEALQVFRLHFQG